MADVAQAVGLSRAAVSMALKKDPSIPASTRKRVEEAARKLGYRPNPLITALMVNLRRAGKGNRRQSETLALLDLNSPEITKARFLSLEFYLEGARKRAENLGFAVELFTMREPGMTHRRLQRILQTRGIQGVILGPLPALAPVIDLDRERFSVASLGYNAREGFDICTHHHYANMMLAIRNLTNRGYRKIGFCSSMHWDEMVYGLYSAAYLHAQIMEKCIASMPLCIFQNEDFKSTFTKWLRKHRPEAIISGMGVPFLEVLKSEGLRVPQDIGFVSLTRMGEHADFAGVYECHEKIGATAVDSVTSQMNRNETGIPESRKVILREGIWFNGKTLAEKCPSR